MFDLFRVLQPSKLLIKRSSSALCADHQKIIVWPATVGNLNIWYQSESGNWKARREGYYQWQRSCWQDVFYCAFCAVWGLSQFRNGIVPQEKAASCKALTSAAVQLRKWNLNSALGFLCASSPRTVRCEVFSPPRSSQAPQIDSQTSAPHSIPFPYFSPLYLSR